MADVLICCAESDRESMRSCADELANAGYEVAFLADADPSGREAAGRAAEALADARAVMVVWSGDAMKSRLVLDAAEQAAATGRLVATRVGSLDSRLIPETFRSFPAGLVTDLERIRRSVSALGVTASGTARGTNPVPSAGPALPIDARILETQAWTFVNEKGNAALIQKFLEAFPDGRFAGRAQERLADLEGTETPEANERRPYVFFAGVAVLLMLMALFGLSRLGERAIVKIPIAAGGSEGGYQQFVDRYNEHLKPFGVMLVPEPDAKNAFDNIRMLAGGHVKAAFINGNRSFEHFC